jgi:hypothetical protein
LLIEARVLLAQEFSMHPMVLSEFHVAKRGMAWQLLLLLSVSVALQWLMGLPGVFLLLSPTIAAIGVASLAEEFSKGELRFLYSLPISPLAFWCTKVIAGVLGISLFVGAVLLPALFVGQPLIGTQRLEELGLSSGGMIAILIGQAVLSYAAGLFTIAFCQVANTAVALAAIISYLPSLAYFVVVAVLGVFPVPRISDAALGLAAASLPLFAGAFVIFRNRNPFFDQPWRWRGLAALFTCFYGMGAIGISYALTLHPLQLTDPYRDGVYYFSTFDQGSKVFALGSRGFTGVDGYVLDSRGRLVRNLFHFDLAAYVHVMNSWREATESSLVFCQCAASARANPKQAFLLDLQSGTQTPMEVKPSDRTTTFDYWRPSRDARYALGFKTVRQGKGHEYFAFRQDLVTSDFREVSLLRGQGGANCLYLDDDHVLINPWSDGTRQTKLTIIDLTSGKRSDRAIPADIEQVEVAPDGKTCTGMRRTIDGDRIRQELAVLDIVGGGWTTVLSSPQVPTFSVRETLAHQEPFISFSYQRSSDWIVWTVNPTKGVPARWLIDNRSRARFKVPEGKEGGFDEFGRFSKDESRFFAFSHPSLEEGIGEHRLDRLRVYRFNKSGIELVNSLDWDRTHRDPAWLGEDRLLFLKTGGTLLGRGELWTVNIATGQEQPFFAGSASAGD